MGFEGDLTYSGITGLDSALSAAFVGSSVDGHLGVGVVFCLILDVMWLE